MSLTIQAGGGVVINEKEQVLMIYRREKWDLPKGKLDPDETIVECAIREVMEETGLKFITLEKKLITTVHEYTEKSQLIQKETHWYLMHASTDTNQTLIPQIEEGIEKIEWVDKKDINRYLQNSYPTIQKVLSLL